MTDEEEYENYLKIKKKIVDITCMTALCKIIFKAAEMEKKQYGAMMLEALGKMLGLFERDPDEYFKGNR